MAEVSKSEQGSKRPLTIELNQADSVQLEALPFIGPVLAGRVVRFRQTLGGFHSVEQLKEVYGMDSLAYSVVSKWVEVDAAQIQTLCLDTASWSTMRSHPYIGTQGARAVERYRMAHGIKHLEDLAGHPPIGDSLFARWRPYVRCCQCTE